MAESLEDLHAQVLERCEELAEHTKRLRDYATSPGSAWLARGELERINQLTGEIERLLSAITKLED